MWGEKRIGQSLSGKKINFRPDMQGFYVILCGEICRKLHAEYAKRSEIRGILGKVVKCAEKSGIRENIRKVAKYRQMLPFCK